MPASQGPNNGQQEERGLRFSRPPPSVSASARSAEGPRSHRSSDASSVLKGGSDLDVASLPLARIGEEWHGSQRSTLPPGSLATGSRPPSTRQGRSDRPRGYFAAPISYCSSPPRTAGSVLSSVRDYGSRHSSAGYCTRSTTPSSAREHRGGRTRTAAGRRPLTPDLVAPPWGPARSNADYPPQEKVREKKHLYQQALDEQTAENQVIKTTKKRHEDLARVEQGATSLVMPEELANMEEAKMKKLASANYKELVTTAVTQKKRTETAKEIERKDFARWAVAAEQEQAMLYQMQHERRKEEWASLAEDWKLAADEKRLRKEADRAAAVLAERRQVERVNVGKVPSRRMRRGKPQDWELQALPESCLTELSRIAAWS